MPRYQQKIITLSDGSRLYLPGLSQDTYPAVASEIDIFDTNAAGSQQFPLGTKLEIGDNTFRYAEFNATIAAGDLVQAEGPDGAHDDLLAVETLAIDGVTASFSAGSKVIHITSTITVIENEYAGGYLVTENLTGEGYAYLIEQNSGDGGSGTDHVFLIKHGLAVAIDGTTEIKLIKSRFQDLIESPTTLTAMVVGVSCAAQIAQQFGWIATKGPWAVFTDGAVVIGGAVMPSNGTAGTVEAYAFTEATPNTAITPRVGYVMDIGATGEFSLIWLELD